MQQTEGRAEQMAQAGRKGHTEFWWVNLLYKSIPVTARIKAWGLRPLAYWDCEFEYRRGRGYLSFVNAILSGTGICVGLITLPEEFYKLWCVHWVWSRSPVMRNHCLESRRGATGGGTLVRRPRDFKEKETGTDWYGVCALKLLGWHWFRVAFKGDLYNFGIGGVKLLAY